MIEQFHSNLIPLKVRSLGHRCEYLLSDIAELQQKRGRMLGKRADAFDPAKASLDTFIDTFIDRVVNSAVGVILRNRQRLKRNTGGPVVSLDDTGNDPARPNSMAHGLSPEHLVWRTGHEPRDASADRETVEAVEAALALMPDDVQKITRRLMAGDLSRV